jgi:hypothetical protein
LLFLIGKRMILVGMDAECIEAIEKKPVKLPTKMVQLAVTPI